MGGYIMINEIKELERDIAMVRLCTAMQYIYAALGNRGQFCCCGVSTHVDETEITEEMWGVLEDAIDEKCYKISNGKHIYIKSNG